MCGQTEDVLEFELCQRYIDPILSGLFDDPDKSILFRWTSVTNEESKIGFITKQRPDSTITRLDGLYYGPSLGFVEVKSAKRGNDKSAISNDLVRLRLLTTNAIDRSNANGSFGIQVIGLTINFFITKLVADGMYTMFDLLSVRLWVGAIGLLQYNYSSDLKLLDELKMNKDEQR